MIVKNSRLFKLKQEVIILDGFPCKKDLNHLSLTLTEAKKLMSDLQRCIMNAESNDLIGSFLRTNGMDETQIETAITQLNKMREKL